MARLEHIRYTPSRFSIFDAQVVWEPIENNLAMNSVPQVIWGTGIPWREANLWALQRCLTREVDIKTVHSNMGSLASYARWLESVAMAWWHFPARKEDRCLVRYKGYLIKARDTGEIAPSTASQRMRDVILFYRWLKASGLFSPEWPMWKEKTATVVVTNQYGFERTMSVRTTDLAIKNRSRQGERLEEGLLPVSSSDRDTILLFAKQHASEELYLLLTLGFYTGMRLGTLADLKIESLQNATPDPASVDLFRISVGPGAKPKVNTKHSVTGQVWITKVHLDLILDYCFSTRRLMREAKALAQNKCLVFLTRFGNPYTDPSKERSSSVNVEMHTLRTKARQQDVQALEGFYFHRARCTFATELAKILIPQAGATNALAIIKEALLHKDEATSLKYIKFVERNMAKIAAANEFTRSFMGISSSSTTH